MFSNTTILFASILFAFSAATVIPRHDGNCNTGPIQCCQNTQSSDGPMASQLFALLGLNIQDVNVPIGITCSPITGIGAGSAGCEAEPVCCENNNFQGIIAIGCVPINIGL